MASLTSWTEVGYVALVKQCSKLSIYFVQTPGAEGHIMMHPVIFPCSYNNVKKYSKIMVHSSGAQVPKWVHPAAKL